MCYTGYTDCLLASCQHNLYDTCLLLCIQCWTPDAGQRTCPKHVEFYSKNKLEKLMHLIGLIIRMVNCIPKPLRTRGKTTLLVEQEAELAQQPVWTILEKRKISCPCQDLSRGSSSFCPSHCTAYIILAAFQLLVSLPNV